MTFSELFMPTFFSLAILFAVYMLFVHPAILKARHRKRWDKVFPLPGGTSPYSATFMMESVSAITGLPLVPEGYRWKVETGRNGKGLLISLMSNDPAFIQTRDISEWDLSFDDAHNRKVVYNAAVGVIRDATEDYLERKLQAAYGKLAGEYPPKRL